MSGPRVSVLMSVYNGERYLHKAIDSVLGQTFTDFEFVILDDGSTDGTAAILDSYRDDRIVRTRNQANIGLTRSLNKGLALARGKYIARHDADDISFPTRLASQVHYLDSHPDVALVSANYERIDAAGRVLGQTSHSFRPELIPWHLLFHNCLGGHSQVMFRLDTVLDLGGYDDGYRYSQDYELWSRLARTHHIHILPQVLLKWRDHEASVSTSQQAAQRDLALKIVNRNLGWILGGEFVSPQDAERLHMFWTSCFAETSGMDDLSTDLKRIAAGFLGTIPSSERLQLASRLSSAVRRQFWRMSRYCGWRSIKGRTALWYSVSWHPSRQR